MQLPLDTEDILSPKLNQRYPQELHWRDPPPECKGGVKKACSKLYPHLVEHFCCMQCGAIPCPFDHETERHIRIKDMEFVRELVMEKKQLEKEFQQLQTEIMDYEQMKKEWNRRKAELEEEIENLHKLTSRQQDKLKDFRENIRKIMSLSQENEGLKDDNQRLKEDSDKYKKMAINQLNEMNKLEQRYTKLQGELSNIKLELHTSKTQMKDAVDNNKVMREKLLEHEAEMITLRKDMQNLLQEIAEKTKQFELKEFELSNRIISLQEEMALLKNELLDTTKDKSDLRSQVDQLLAEINRLRNRLSTDRRFQQFVAIKREVNGLKEINDVLYHKVLEKPDPIPVMTKYGRVTTNKRVTEPTPKLHRPKSAMNILKAKEYGRTIVD